MMTPFLTLIVPSYRRPLHRARCMASVRAQTAADDLQVFSPEDVVGRGIAGMYASLPDYAPAVRGQYVHVLADDDELMDPDVVARVRHFAMSHGGPPVILVNSIKMLGGRPVSLPIKWRGAPVCGEIDLGCLIVRADVWTRHVGAYGHRYEGDYDFAATLHQAGHAFARLDLDFLRGAVMCGAPEAGA